MAGHVYHELYVHLVWHTKDSRGILTQELEPIVHEHLWKKCLSLGGIYPHGVGGTPNHIHMAVNYEPEWSVSEIVKNLKGASAHDINKQFRRRALEWQRGYGAVSYGMRNLRTVLDYIKRQKEHHASGSIHARLERIRFDEGDYGARERGGRYVSGAAGEGEEDV